MKDKVQNSFEEKVDFGNSLSLSGKDLKEQKACKTDYSYFWY